MVTRNKGANVRRFIIAPDGIQTILLVDGQVVLAHRVENESGATGWVLFLKHFGLKIGRHMGNYENGRMIEVVNVQTKTRVAGLFVRLSHRKWQIDIPED